MNHEISYFDANGKVVLSEVKAENGWTINAACAWNGKLKLGFSWETSSDGKREWLKIPVAKLREEGANRFKDIVPFAGRIAGVEGDGGALVLPLDSGRLCHTKGKKEAEEFFGHFTEPAEWQVSWSNMSFIGQFANGKAQMAIIEGAKFDVQLRVRTSWGEGKSYAVDAVFMIRDFADDAPLDEDITVAYEAFKGDWRAIAKAYRTFIKEVRRIPSLAEKSKDNPDLDYSARAITVRCRMGVKPLPCKIPEQTPENEPPIKVFLTFAQIREIADEFAKQKVGAAEFCLVGWGNGGHDGSFPQLFPVPECFGGEAELRRTIEHVKKLGYHISLHDNCYDGYSLARNFDMDDICKLHDGSRRKTSCGVLAGGQPYRVCAQREAEKYAPSNFPKCKALGINGAYFVDVISIIGMVKCYDKRHPLSRGGNGKYYKRIMKMMHDTFGVSMSEGARDWAMPELDRAYMVLNCIKAPYECVDELVPVYEIVHHGNIVYNNFREGINCFPGHELHLKNLAWGGLPLVYFHHLFHPDWKANSGWANDLTLEGPEKLAADVAKIKRMSDDVAKLAHLRFVELEDIIEHGETLVQTLYANGQSVWANYAASPAKTPDGKTVPAMDFIVA